MKKQRQKRQQKASSKNGARYRKRDDSVYREAHLDDIIRHQIRVGHAPEWIAVLNGAAPGIVLPIGGTNIDKLKACRQAVLDMHGKAAPETTYDKEFDQYLSPGQLEALDHGSPVILMASVERQFDITLQRRNSLLQNRVRDAIEFGIGQSIQYIGRLWLPVEAGKTCTVGRASTEALLRFSEAWAPQYEGEEADWWSGYVEHLKGAGSLHERADYFVDPAIRHELIKAEIRSITGVNSSVKIERQFWHTVILSLLKCKNHDGPQASAHRRISRSHQMHTPVARADVLDFMGVRSNPMALVDLMALAYFEMPDAYRLSPTFHFHFPDFEALAALGALTRGRSVRVDAKTARRLDTILSWPKPVGTGSEEATPDVLNAEQFIRHAMARVGSDEWWTYVLQSPPDNFGVRHIKRGVLAPLTEEEPLKLENLSRTEPFGTLINLVKLQYRFQVNTLYGNRIWECPASSGAAIIDLSRMHQYCGSSRGALAQILVELAAAGLYKDFDHAHAQTRSPEEPGFYREMVRIAAASLTVMRRISSDHCERRELDLRYYARFLTDREYQLMYIYGEITGYIILAALGHDVSAEVLEVTSRHRQLHAVRPAA